MRTLVVYYTRTGNTRTVAESLAKGLDCDIEEIGDNKKRTGFIGSTGAYLNPRAVTTIKDTKYNPKYYDPIILGTPIWWYTYAPAVTAYLNRFREHLKKAAFFYTCDANVNIKALWDMEKLLGMAPVATLGIESGSIRNNTFEKKVRRFVKEFKK